MKERDVLQFSSKYVKFADTKKSQHFFHKS